MATNAFIIKSSLLNKRKFMRLSATSKMLYFYLNADADQDGIVDAPMTIQRAGLSDNDLTQLSPDFITLLEPDDGVIFINDWTLHNTGLEMRKNNRSDYFDLIVKMAPTAKVFIAVLEFTINKNGELSSKLSKKVVPAIEASLRINHELLRATGALKEREEKLIQSNKKEDNEINKPEWISNYDLLISRGIFPQDAKFFAQKYSQDEILKYISYSLLNAQFDSTALLADSLRKNYNIDAFVDWGVCGLCNGSGWNDYTQTICCQCSGTGKIPHRKEKKK